MSQRFASIKGLAFLAALSVLAFGCKPPDNIRDSALDQQPPKVPKTHDPLTMAFSAGVNVPQGIMKAAPMVVVARANPFALTPSEASFDKEQTAAYLATTQGSFPMFFQPPPENLAPPEVEPQPYRRLAGILIGESVVALIDMGNGHIEEIYPGETIPGTQWKVVSIDSEKAVLQRVGSNRLPNEIVVRLESAPANATPEQPTNNNPFGGAGGQGFSPNGPGGPGGIGGVPSGGRFGSGERSGGE